MCQSQQCVSEDQRMRPQPITTHLISAVRFLFGALIFKWVPNYKDAYPGGYLIRDLSSLVNVWWIWFAWKLLRLIFSILLSLSGMKWLKSFSTWSFKGNSHVFFFSRCLVTLWRSGLWTVVFRPCRQRWWSTSTSQTSTTARLLSPRPISPLSYRYCYSNDWQLWWPMNTIHTYIHIDRYSHTYPFLQEKHTHTPSCI